MRDCFNLLCVHDCDLPNETCNNILLYRAEVIHTMLGYFFFYIHKTNVDLLYHSEKSYLMRLKMIYLGYGDSNSK